MFEKIFRVFKKKETEKAAGFNECYHKSFLISCVGAYDDSGIGTGGMVCINNGQAVEIDKMDCTGLFCHGENVYRFVRSMQSIIGYNKEGIKFLLRLPETKDVHDIAIKKGNIICVSTGTNEILWFDPFGKFLKKWNVKGVRDAWHLNCLYFVGDKLYVSAFGEFENHRGWSNDKCLGKGFILELDSNKKVLNGLSGPHSPRYIDCGWTVCESHINTLTIQDCYGNIRKIKFNGFTRGLAFDEQYLYVGESVDRKTKTPIDYSFVAIVDRKDLKIVDRIKIPFPEIYEILLISSELAATMANAKEKFSISKPRELKRSKIKFIEVLKKLNV